MPGPTAFRARATFAALVPVFALVFTGCDSGWSHPAEVDGYAVCDAADPTRLTLGYTSGEGVTDTNVTVDETDEVVEVEITVSGSGAWPAIGIPAEVDTMLASSLGDREVRDANGAAVPVHACE